MKTSYKYQRALRELTTLNWRFENHRISCEEAIKELVGLQKSYRKTLGKIELTAIETLFSTWLRAYIRAAELEAQEYEH